MAIITLEGKLHIDLADVWAWLGKEGYTKSQDFKALAFSVEDDALVLTKAVEEADQSSVYVEAAEFWRWVIDQQLPAGLEGFESVFGVPEVSQNYSLDITFAASNESDPRSWAVAPACMAEWSNARRKADEQGAVGEQAGG